MKFLLFLENSTHQQIICPIHKGKNSIVSQSLAGFSSFQKKNVSIIPFSNSQIFYNSNQPIVSERKRKYQSLENLYLNYSPKIDSIYNLNVSPKSKIESSKSINTLLPVKNYINYNRNSGKLNSFHKRYDKFGNELPVWAKPEDEDTTFDIKPYELDIFKVTHVIPQTEGHIKTGAPQFIRKLAPAIKRNEGQYAQLELEILGVPEPHVTWFKDNVHLRNSTDTRISSKFGVHSLVIPEVYAQDSGIYKALITSPLGILESYCHLIVEGVFLFYLI